MDPRDAEAFLGLSVGAFDHIPPYARPAALEAIAKVRRLEQEKTFRPGLSYARRAQRGSEDAALPVR